VPIHVDVRDFPGTPGTQAQVQNALDWMATHNNTSSPAALALPDPTYTMETTLRMPGYVRMFGSGVNGTAIYWPSDYCGHGIELGPDYSGHFGWSGICTYGTVLEDMTIIAADSMSHVIYSVGAHQFCGLKRLQIRNVNQCGVYLGSAAGPANFEMEQLHITGGDKPSLNVRRGIDLNNGGVTSARILTVEGTSAQPFVIGLRQTFGNLDLVNWHQELVQCGVSLEQNFAYKSMATVRHMTTTGAIPATVLQIHPDFKGCVEAVGVDSRHGNTGVTCIAIDNLANGQVMKNTLVGSYSYPNTQGAYTVDDGWY
jgi:hypothetical protein